MRRLPLLLTLFAAACGPTRFVFQDAYQERWCEVFLNQCLDEPVPELCRATGRPLEDDPTLPDCRYDREAARLCVMNRWTCDAGEVTPPLACDRVWTCPDDD